MIGTRTAASGTGLPSAAEWEELARRSGAPPFLYPGWFSAWRRAFGRGRAEHCLVRGPGGELKAIAPLERSRGTLRAPANWHSPAFDVLAVDEESRAELGRRLLGSSWHCLDLGLLPAGGGLANGLFEEDLARGGRPLRRQVQSSPYIEIDGSFETFEAGLRRKFRSELRRRRRRMAEAGEVAIEISDGTERLAKTLSEGFAVEASGWKGRRGTAIATNAATHRFYSEIAGWAAERGWLRLGVLRLDGTPVAFDFSLVHDGVCYMLKAGIRPEVGRFSPGRVLTHALVEQAFQTGLRAYELLGQNERHKLEWTDTVRRHERIQLFAATLPGRIARLAWTRGRPAAKRAFRRRTAASRSRSAAA